MLLFHIIIALLSLVSASLTAFHPTKKKIILTYISIAGTLVSGVLLTVFESAAIARVCLSGSVYLIAVFFLLRFASKKMVVTVLY